MRPLPNLLLWPKVIFWSRWTPVNSQCLNFLFVLLLTVCGVKGSAKCMLERARPCFWTYPVKCNHWFDAHCCGWKLPFKLIRGMLFDGVGGSGFHTLLFTAAFFQRGWVSFWVLSLIQANPNFSMWFHWSS